MLKLFLFSYIQLLLLAVLSRFVNREQYVGIFFISSTVGIAHFTIFQTMLQSGGDIYNMISFALGGALGNISGTWLHRRFSKKELI